MYEEIRNSSVLMAVNCFFFFIFTILYSRTDGIVSLYRYFLGLLCMLMLLLAFKYSREKIKCYIEVVVFLIFHVFLAFEVIELLSYIYSRLIYCFITLAIVILVPHIKNEIEGRGKKLRYAVAFLIECFMWFFSIVDVYQSKGFGSAFALFVLMYVWCLLFVDLGMGVIGLIGNYIHCDKLNLIKIPHVDWVCFGIVFFTGLFFSIVYYPGIITPDNVMLYNASQHIDVISERTDIHSFLYVLVFRMLLELVNNYYIITICMVVLFSLVWKRMIRVFHLFGVNDIVLVFLVLIWLSFPRNIWMLIATWKDIPFTICMYLFFIENCIWIIGGIDNMAIMDFFLLGLSLFGISSFRTNGMFVVAGILVFYLILWIKKAMDKRIVITILVAVSTVLLYKGPVFSFINVSLGEPGFAALPFLDGIWENVAQENDLSDETIKTIEEIMPFESFKKDYREASVYFGNFPNGYAGLNMSGIVEAYIDCLKRHPFDTLLSRAKKSYSIWAFFPHNRFVLDTNYEPEIRDFTELGGEKWDYIPLFEPIREIFQSQYIGANDFENIYYSLNRNGVCIVIWLIFFLYAYMNKRLRIMLLALPLVLNTVVLLVCCCYQDCCYTYPMTAITLQFCLAFLIYMNLDINNEKDSQITLI